MVSGVRLWALSGYVVVFLFPSATVPASAP